MSKLNTLQRLLGAAGAGLALCAFTLPAAAQQAEQEFVQSVDSVVVTRDADTGKLRPASAAEQASLKAAKVKQMRAATPTVLPKVHSTGARGVRLNDEFLSSSVAVRNSDGQIVMECHESHGGAEPAVAHVHPAANTPVTE